MDAAQGRGQDDTHTSSEVQKQPRSHGTHCNNSKQYDSASASKAFVSATGLLCLCAGSQGDACDHDHNFHILCVRVKKHIVGSHPVTVHIPMWQQRSSTATKKARINKKKNELAYELGLEPGTTRAARYRYRPRRHIKPSFAARPDHLPRILAYL